MKHSDEFKAFDKLVGEVLAVPRGEFLRREEEYKRQSLLNPNRRGPKLKKKHDGHGPVVSSPS
jgi:hypothetical protein